MAFHRELKGSLYKPKTPDQRLLAAARAARPPLRPWRAADGAAGAPWPWSGDDVLNRHKFTNVKREHDRVTA